MALRTRKRMMAYSKKSTRRGRFELHFTSKKLKFSPIKIKLVFTSGIRANTSVPPEKGK